MMEQDMNPKTTSRIEPTPGVSHCDALESLEARLWDRARRNLRLLYNGARLSPIAATATNAGVGPLAVNPKV